MSNSGHFHFERAQIFSLMRIRASETRREQAAIDRAETRSYFNKAVQDAALLAGVQCAHKYVQILFDTCTFLDIVRFQNYII